MLLYQFEPCYGRPNAFLERNIEVAKRFRFQHVRRMRWLHSFLRLQYFTIGGMVMPVPEVLGRVSVTIGNGP
jgi:hypothetical protein